MKYKLMNKFNWQESIDFTAGEDEEPHAVALETLGWYILASKGEYDDDQQEFNFIFKD